jgi:hypothetical protein
MILSRYIIIPYILKLDDKQPVESAQPEISSKPTEEAYVYETIKPRKYYIAQAGYFSSMANAESLLSRIRQANLPAYVNKEAQYFRVIVYIDADKAKVNKKIGDYKSLGYECIAREINLSFKEIPESSRKDNKYILLTKMINEGLKVTDENKDSLNKYENKSIDFNTMKDKLDTGYKDLSGLLSKYNEIKDKENEKTDELIKRYEVIVNMLNEISKLNNDNTFIQKAYEKEIQSIYLLNELSAIYNGLF